MEPKAFLLHYRPIFKERTHHKQEKAELLIFTNFPATWSTNSDSRIAIASVLKSYKYLNVDKNELLVRAFSLCRACERFVHTTPRAAFKTIGTTMFCPVASESFTGTISWVSII